MLLSCCPPVLRKKNNREDLKTFDVQEEATDASAPGVNVTAAPGVAFNYRYAFQLPSSRIAAAQEAHASACETLGLTKCRITGMRYKLIGDKDVEAMLALRLDPTVARDFGKRATDVVSKAEGRLTDQEITGEDVGSKINSANASEADLRQELRSIEAQIDRPPVTSSVPAPPTPPGDYSRANLQNRAQEIRNQLRSVGAARAGDQEALAGTPMVFHYVSGDVVPGLDARSPVRNAMHTAVGSFTTMFSFVLLLIAVLLPWLLLSGLAWWIVSRLNRRFGWTSGARFNREHKQIEPAPDAQV